jgi:hypothetical protein
LRRVRVVVGAAGKKRRGAAGGKKELLHLFSSQEKCSLPEKTAMTGDPPYRAG